MNSSGIFFVLARLPEMNFCPEKLKVIDRPKEL